MQWCTCALQPLAAYAPTMTVMGNHEAAGGFAEYSVRFQSAAVSAHVVPNRVSGPVHYTTKSRLVSAQLL